MKRPISRVIAGAELLLLVLPVSAMAVQQLLLALFPSLGNRPRSPLGFEILAGPMLVALPAVVAIWRVLWAFILAGPPALAMVRHFWWWLLGAGSAMALLPWVIAIGGPLMSPPSAHVFILFGVGYAGTPLLVPAVHVSIERWLYMRSNNRFDRDGGAIGSG